jgi:hypothetical protein
MTNVAIPATMADITPEWLTTALRANGHITSSVTSAEKVTIGQGVGILGELARVTLNYSAPEPKGPETLVAKIPTADPGGKGIAEMLGFYEKEVRFYNELTNSVGVRAARSYFAGGDPSTIQYVVLMEDLGALAIGDQVAGATAEECSILLSEMARLHAKWWNSPELDRIDWIPAVNSPVIKLSALAYAQALEPFLKNFGDHLTGQQVEMATKYMTRMNPMQDTFASRPYTLCHGDLRLDNVFWGSPDNSSPVTLIDWQIAIKARGAYDIGYFMSQSVEPAIRAANEETLVKEYHRVLQENGVVEYSWDQCWDDYRATTMGCLTYPVVAAGSIDLANERGLELAKKMMDRSLSAITDLKAYEILDRFEDAPLPAIPGA